MKSVHFFISALVFNFASSINIVTADNEVQASPVNEHRVTPLSPDKKAKNMIHPVTPLQQLDHGVTPLDHGVTPVDHGVTPLKDASDLQANKENNNPAEQQLGRSESFNRNFSESSHRSFNVPLGNGILSTNSLTDLYILVAANGTPSSPRNKRGLFPSCNTNQQDNSFRR